MTKSTPAPIHPHRLQSESDLSRAATMEATSRDDGTARTMDSTRQSATFRDDSTNRNDHTGSDAEPDTTARIPLPGRFHSPRFSSGQDDPITVDSILDVFFPRQMLTKMCTHTNNHILNSGVSAAPVEPKDLYLFFAIYYYMGYIEGPSKIDYWNRTSPFSPKHALMERMSWSRFQLIWDNIHFTCLRDAGDADTDTDEASGVFDTSDSVDENFDFDDECSRMGDYWGQSSDDSDSLDEISSSPEDDEEPEIIATIKSWLREIQPFLDHVNEVSKQLCKFPGSECAVNEMIVRLTRQSRQAIRMGEDQAKHTHKFYGLCCSTTGFVYHVLPASGMDGMANAGGTILDLLRTLDDQHQYVVAMQRRLATTTVLQKSREMKVGIVGPAQMQYGVAMGKSTRLINYCRPDLRCKRPWVRVIFHLLDIMKANAKIAFSALAERDNQTDPNRFLQNMIEALARKAGAQEEATKKRGSNEATVPRGVRVRQRCRMSSTRPSLDNARFEGDPSDHLQVISQETSQRVCRYCAYLNVVAKKEGKQAPKLRRVRRMCIVCNVHICKSHWDDYHKTRIPEDKE